MKLSAAIDLEPHRAEALRQVDNFYLGRFQALAAWDPLYSAKLALAHYVVSHGGRPGPAIIAEAGLKGIDPTDLCHAIVDKGEAQVEKVATLELERQSWKVKVARADSHHEIRDLVATMRTAQ